MQGTKVIFAPANEPCIQYTVLQGPEPEYDNVCKAYCMCLKLEVIGWVAKDLLTEASHPDNVNAIDVAVKLQIK